MLIATIYHRFRIWLSGSVKNKFLFWNISFWILSVIVLSLTFLWTGQSEIMSDIRNRNIQIASIVSRDINARISGIISDIRIFSHHLELLGEDMEGQASALINLRISSPQRYTGAYLFNSNNNLLVHVTDPIDFLIGLDDIKTVTRRPVIPVSDTVFAATMKANNTGTYISRVEFTGIDQMPIVSIAVPVTYESGISRVLIVQVDVRDIWQMINLTTIGNSGFTYAVDHDGTVIAHPDLSHLGHPLSEEIDEVLEGYEGFKEYFDEENDRTVYASYSPVGSPTNWGIIVEQSKLEANGPILRTTIIVIIVGLSLATIGTIGILLLIQNFTNPILALTQTVRRIQDSGSLQKTYMESRPDEIGQLSHSFDQMIEWMESMRGRIETVAAEERNRLARDLHDAVSQTLFSASIIAEVLPTLWETNIEKGRERLEEVRELTRGALAEMRTLLLELRPSALLEAELPLLLSQLSVAINARTRIPVHFNGEGECENLPDDVKVALYRIAQEALNNVAKHSEAKKVYISMLCEQDKVIIDIIDDGVGFDTESITADHLGVGIMKERAEDIGASLTVHSSIGKGTEITVIWENK